MRQILQRFRYFVATLLFAFTTSMSTGGAVFAATGDNPNPMPWTGQGTTGGSLNTVKCEGDTASPGTLLWVFTLGGNNSVTSASLTLSGSGSGTYPMSPTGNNMKAVTPYYDLSTLNASASYVGGLGSGESNLVISHGCPATSIQPAAVSFSNPTCETAGFYTVTATTGVVYKDANGVVQTAGNHSVSAGAAVHITAYPASSSVVLTGTTDWSHTFTVPEHCTAVTPATVAVTENCGTANDSFTIPVNGNGITYTHTFVGNVLTVTATPDATHHLVAGNGFTLNQNGTATFTYTFTNSECPPPVDMCKNIDGVQAEVPNNLVRAEDGNCYKKVWVCKYVGTPGVNERLKTGNDGLVNVSVNAIDHNQWDGTVPGWFSDAQDRSYVLAYDNGQPKPSVTECPQPSCGCEPTVTPGTVTFYEVCGYTNDTYTIPNTAHVNYYVNGSLIPATPGVHHVTAGESVTVTAEATDGYTLSGTHSWSHHFTDVPCVVKVYPPKVEFKDLCEVKDDTFTIPSKIGVEYMVNGHVITTGTYKAGDYAVNGTVTVTAVAKEGYKLKGGTSWMHTFTNEQCQPGGHGGEIPATPAVATFADVCATANDTYTVPATVGVTYKVNGTVTAAGSYSGSGTVTVTAEAMPGYVLNGPASWSHTYTNESCGQPQVLGESTTVVFTPVPAGHGAEAPAAELANTGQNSLASAAAAFLVLVSAIFVYAFVPKRELS